MNFTEEQELYLTSIIDMIASLKSNARQIYPYKKVLTPLKPLTSGERLWVKTLISFILHDYCLRNNVKPYNGFTRESILLATFFSDIENICMPYLDKEMGYQLAVSRVENLFQGLSFMPLVHIIKTFWSYSKVDYTKVNESKVNSPLTESVQEHINSFVLLSDYITECFIFLDERMFGNLNATEKYRELLDDFEELDINSNLEELKNWFINVFKKHS